MTTKYIEQNVPSDLVLQVQYFHDGNSTKGMRRKTFRQSTDYATVAMLIDPQSRRVVARGSACCSKKDQPNRQVGRQVAVGRALRNYNEYVA